MVRDFGGGGRPRWRRGERLLFLRSWVGGVLLAAIFALFAALPTAMALSGGFHSDPGRVVARSGVACQVIDKPRFDRGWREPPMSFTFAGATFARRRGDAECTGRVPGGLGRTYAACAFTAPFQIAVAARGRQAWFEVGAGVSAVVEADAEGLRCTVTGRNRREFPAAPLPWVTRPAE